MGDVSEREQYASTANLSARVALHGYATNSGWIEWLFERETPERDTQARILDVGCGMGGFWSVNRDRIGPGWSLTLVDSSEAMVEAAKSALGERASYAVADVQELPYEADAFDVVVANHMLYHVPDRPRAFAEIRRVLISGGAFHASTNGRGHLAELSALRPGLTKISANTEAFGLETATAQLTPFFVDVRVDRFDNTLVVPEAEPVLAYIRSSASYRQGDELVEERGIIEDQIASTGSFTIATRPGVVSCTKP